MNENPNTNGGNIDDILEIIKKRREEGITPVSNDAPTRIDNDIVKPAAEMNKDEVQQSLFDTTAENSSADTRLSEAPLSLDNMSTTADAPSEVVKDKVENDVLTAKTVPPVSDSSLKPSEGAFEEKQPALPKPEEATTLSPITEKPATNKDTAKEETPKKAASEKNAESKDVSSVSLSDFDSVSKTEVKKIKKRTKEKFYIPGYVKVIIYLAIVLTISVFLSITAIFIGNDIFAFKKPEKDYKLSIAAKPSWEKIAQYFHSSVDNSLDGIDTEENSQFLFGDYATLETVAQELHKSGVIEYPSVFKIYAETRMDENYYTGRFVPGEYELSGKDGSILNYDNLIEQTAENKYKKEIVKITIPEGFSIYQILDLLEKNHVIDKTSRLKLIEKLNSQYYDYNFLPTAPEGADSSSSDTDRYQHLAISYALLDTLEEKGIINEAEKQEYIDKTNAILDKYAPVKPKINEDVIYNLEGFLFPDTYEFYVGEDLDSIVTKFLDNFKIKYEDTFYTAEGDRTPTFEESRDVIILASIIQAEGNNSADFYLISNVFHNRLNNPGKLGRRTPILESDATSVYALQGSIKRSEISAEDIKNIDSPYNTYTNEGLPPGPICNPGHDAIHAALYPAEYITTVDENGNSKTTPVEYYYFYAADSNGKTYFSETLEQHNAFIEADMRGDVEELERLQNQVNR